MPNRPHWIIRKHDDVFPQAPWVVEHRYVAEDEHFCQNHEYGNFPTYRQALTALQEWSWTDCGLPLNVVPFYGLELGIHTPDGLRTCALDLSGFRHLHQALLYAHSLRAMSASAVMARAGQDGHRVCPMDAEGHHMGLPVVGATVYMADPDDGTVWSQDLLSWETPTFAPAR